ncbi:MAG: YciI family protein [Chthoniobacterales bacterium]
MHYLLFYEKVADYAERQKPLQSAHRDYLQKLTTQGVLILGGSLENPNDGSAILLFDTPSSDHVESFAKNDPYVSQGIIAKWHVRKWDTVVGSGINN